MSIFDKFLQRLGYSPTKAAQQPIPDWAAAYARGEQYNIQDYMETGQEVDLYTKLSWVHMAVKFVSYAAVPTKMRVYQQAKNGEEEVKSHDLLRLLQHPNPNQSRFEFLDSTYSYYLLCGNAYWWLNLVDGKPAEMWTLPANMMKPIPDEKMYIKGYQFSSGMGENIFLTPDEVVHFKNFNSKNQFEGASPFEAARMDISTELGMSSWNNKNFGKNNGRLPGILTFKDWVDDKPWEEVKKMTADAAEKRNQLLLRGVGSGVNWIQNAMNMKDLEFIEGRTFTKEQLWNLVAPGLSSILSVNATEANAKTGKATMIEMAVWPMLTMTAEKITNDLLNLYEEGTFAQFDDIRVTDRVLDLDEQREYAKTHTIDEIRKKYYGDDPLPEKGHFLPVEISAGMSADKPVVEEEPELNRTPRDAGTNAGEIDDPDDGNGVKADLIRWRKVAINRIKKGKPADSEFVSEAIPEAMKEVIHSSLKSCGTVEDVKAAFEEIENSVGDEPQLDKINLVEKLKGLSPEDKAAMLTQVVAAEWREYP